MKKLLATTLLLTACAHAPSGMTEVYGMKARTLDTQGWNTAYVGPTKNEELVRYERKEGSARLAVVTNSYVEQFPEGTRERIVQVWFDTNGNARFDNADWYLPMHSVTEEDLAQKRLFPEGDVSYTYFKNGSTRFSDAIRGRNIDVDEPQSLVGRAFLGIMKPVAGMIQHHRDKKDIAKLQQDYSRILEEIATVSAR
jgi:hypothetical protein